MAAERPGALPRFLIFFDLPFDSASFGNFAGVGEVIFDGGVGFATVEFRSCFDAARVFEAAGCCGFGEACSTLATWDFVTGVPQRVSASAMAQ